MAKKKAPELTPEAQAANTAGQARREKEKQSRQRNAEKQKRFREGMKEAGYKRVTLWEPLGPSGAHGRMLDMGLRQIPAWETPLKPGEKPDKNKVRFAVQISEKSLHAAARLPEVKKAISRATSEFLHTLGGRIDKSLSKEMSAVYNDFLELVKVLDDPGGEG